VGTQNVLGVNYDYPDEGDEPWGAPHIAWATAVSEATNTLQEAVASNYDLSDSCGSFLTTSATYVAVTNLSATIVTTGKPIVIAIIDDGNGTNASSISVLSATVNNPVMFFRFLRNGVPFDIRNMSTQVLSVPGASLLSGSTPLSVDFQPAGTYTYTIETTALNTNVGCRFNYKKLFVYELR